MSTMTIQRILQKTVKILAPLVIAALAAGLSLNLGSHPARAGVFIVDTTADSVDVTPGDGVCTDASNVCSLRAAIQEANALGGASVITLPVGIYTLGLPGADEEASATGDLDITAQVTINGAGAISTTVDGGQLDRVLHIASDAMSQITGVTITNGKTVGGSDNVYAEDGGGISNEGTLTLDDCVISGNASGSGNGVASAGGLGGGIYNAGTLTLNRSAVRNNSTGSGGSDGEGGYGGGIYNSFTATLTINASTIDGNQTGDGGTDASGGSGGGLFNVGAASLVDSTISNNTTATGGYGGGASNIGTLDLINCTVSGNASREDGGGIDNASAGTVTLNSVTIANNTADSDSNDSGDGGGIFNEEGTVSLANTILAGNSDPSGQAPDGSGTLTSQGYNLIQSTTGYTLTGSTTGDVTGQNPQLAPLASDSGLTQVHALQSASPAIDAGNPATPGSGGNACPATDQRGSQRSDARCDIGAFEMQITDNATIVRSVASTGTYLFGPTAVKITVATQGTLTSLTVQQINDTPPNAEPGMQTGYYWKITPNTGASNFVLNLTFPLNGMTSEFGSMVCRYNTTYSVWDCSIPTVDAVAGTVTLSGVRQLSTWALSEVTPTAVTVRSFTVQTTTSDTSVTWIVALVTMVAMVALLLAGVRRHLALVATPS